MVSLIVGVKDNNVKLPSNMENCLPYCFLVHLPGNMVTMVLHTPDIVVGTNHQPRQLPHNC